VLGTLSVEIDCEITGNRMLSTSATVPRDGRTVWLVCFTRLKNKSQMWKVKLLLSSPATQVYGEGGAESRGPHTVTTVALFGHEWSVSSPTVDNS